MRSELDKQFWDIISNTVARDPLMVETQRWLLGFSDHEPQIVDDGSLRNRLKGDYGLDDNFYEAALTICQDLVTQEFIKE